MKILYIDCSFGFDGTMLLGALTDVGADLDEIVSSLKEEYPDITFKQKEVLRNHLECKHTEIFSEHTETSLGQYPVSDGANPLVLKATRKAIQSLGIDYVITSSVPLGDGTDGAVISLFEKAGIDMFPAEGTQFNMHIADAYFLTTVVNDGDIRPDMDVLAVGYGASSGEGMVMVTIGYMNTDEIKFCAEELEQIF